VYKSIPSQMRMGKRTNLALGWFSKNFKYQKEIPKQNPKRMERGINRKIK
jgi:hypothetical protein